MKGESKGRGSLGREAIVAAAIEIADSEGLEAVSIRGVAGALGARPMSLYDHIGNKNELLWAMADQVNTEVLIAGGLPPGWRPAVTAIAHRTYVTFIRHPWIPILFGRRPVWGPTAIEVTEQAAEALREMPVAQEQRWLFFGTVNDYVLGHSLRAIAGPHPGTFGELLSEAELKEWPELASLPASLRSRATLERFELGLEIVLDGIERQFGQGGSGG